MEPKREAEGGEANGMSYPSPGPEAMDSSRFYHTRDDAQEPQDQTGEHAPDANQMPEHQNGHVEDDPASRPTNLEELQLAAQLGHGLSGTPILPATDPNMSVEDPGLRNIMPNPEPDHQHLTAYAQEPPPPEPVAHHPIPIPVAPHMPSHYSHSNDHIPPRKRSKVSRACDECRRKKIKCDAPSDTGEIPCTSCAKASITCLFSRVPQKRGPSKGYIKELADRINSIESKLAVGGAVGQEDLEKLFAPERPRKEGSESAANDSSKKRPYADISSGDFSTPTTERHVPWSADQRSIHPATGTPDSYPPYDNGELAPPPSDVKPDDAASRPPMAPMDVPMPDNEEFPEVDDGILHDYVTYIQPIYPILPKKTSRLQSLLIQSPSPVRTAFLNALLAVTQPTGETAKLASSLLNDWESNDTPRTLASNIVHAQALILLIVDAEWRSSSTLPFLIARAVGLANDMKLWRYNSVNAASVEESDDHLCMRIWWSLVLIDRWHAVGTGKPVQIPDSSVVIPSNVQAIIGETSFYLLRLSKVLSKLAQVISSLPDGANTADAQVAAVLKDYVENFREDLPASIQPSTHPTVHLAYWHCRTAIVLLTPHATPAELVWPIKELVKSMSTNSELSSPLMRQFASLTTFALATLCRADATREEGAELTRGILDGSGTIWEDLRGRLGDLVKPVSATETTASQSLKHLATLAAGHDGELVAPENTELVPSLANGYLGGA